MRHGFMTMTICRPQHLLPFSHNLLISHICTAAAIAFPRPEFFRRSRPHSCRARGSALMNSRVPEPPGAANKACAPGVRPRRDSAHCKVRANQHRCAWHSGAAVLPRLVREPERVHPCSARWLKRKKEKCSQNIPACKADLRPALPGKSPWQTAGAPAAPHK